MRLDSTGCRMDDDKTSIEEQYGSAIRTTNLRSRERTARSAADVLGAVGYAGRRIRCGEGDKSDRRAGKPLAMALLRLFVGGRGEERQLIEILSDMLARKAPRMRIEISEVQRSDMAKAVLAWHRGAVCKPCGGHGYELIHGTPSLSAQECRACHGTGKWPFESQFRQEWRGLARWLLVEIEREQAVAGPEAMKALAPKLDL